jgi:hypothetical protein
MRHPKKAHLKNDGTVILYFEDDDTDLFYLRGGICWPHRYTTAGSQDYGGFGLVVGYNIEERKAYVFGQRFFRTVNNILVQDTPPIPGQIEHIGHKIEHRGVADWFVEMWSKFYVRTYYWSQDSELAKKFRVEISRSNNIQPKPRFPEVQTPTKFPESIIWEYIKLGKIQYEAGSPLHLQLKQDQHDAPPAAHALLCCLAGIEKNAPKVLRQGG